jgi:hypothetical protein
MADPAGNKKAAHLKEETLHHGKKIMWEKNRHTWLALYWADPIMHAGSGQATVTLKTDVATSPTHYNVPQVGIHIEKHAGSLENNTGETIRYILT